MLLEKALRSIVKILGISEGFQTFRQDMMGIFVEHCTPSGDQAPTNLRRQIVNCRNRAKKNYLGDAAFILGSASVVLSQTILPHSGLHFGVFGLVISVLAAFRAVTIELLGFGFPSKNRKPIELQFMKGWNCGALKPWNAMLAVPVVAILMKIHPWGYKLGMVVVKRYTELRCE